MKTKLDLHLAVQRLAEATLDTKSVTALSEQLDAVLKPVNLEAHDRATFSQLFYSRRQKMLELRNEPLPEPAAPAAAAASPKP